jgi:hypothetical protein
MYAWSDIYLGGESREMKDGRKIVLNRKILQRGEKVTAKQLEISNDEFAELKRKGVVRDYPLPDGLTDDYPGSPIEFVRDQLAAAVEATEESANAESEMLLRSYTTGSIFALPDDHAEPPLPSGVEEVK